MTRSTPHASDAPRSRSVSLARAGSAALVDPGSRASAATREITPPMVVPAREEFEGSYSGQFLTVLGRDSEQGDTDEVRAACEDLPWPVDETGVNRGQLADRRSDEPIGVRLPVFVGGRRAPITADILFVINRTSPCHGESITCQMTSVELRSVRGDEPDPKVTETDTEGFGEGCGVTTGILGAGITLLATWLRREA